MRLQKQWKGHQLGLDITIMFGYYYYVMCVLYICVYKPQLVITNIQCVSRDAEDVYFIEIVAVALFLELHLLGLNSIITSFCEHVDLQ